MIPAGREKSRRKCHNATQYGIIDAVLQFRIPCSCTRFSPYTVERTSVGMEIRKDGIPPCSQ